MTKTPITAANADLPTRILAHLTGQGPATCDILAEALGVDEPDVEQAVQGLLMTRQAFLPTVDPGGTLVARSSEWVTTLGGSVVVPGEIKKIHHPLPDLLVIEVESLPNPSDDFDDRTAQMHTGFMVQRNGILHVQVFGSLEKAVLFGIALRHVDPQESLWAAGAFLKIIGKLPREDT